MSITIVPGIPVYIWEQMLYGDSSRVTRRTHLPIEPLLTTTAHFPHIVVGPPGNEVIDATEYAAKQVDVGWVAILSRLGYEGISWIF